MISMIPLKQINELKSHCNIIIKNYLALILNKLRFSNDKVMEFYKFVGLRNGHFQSN